MSIEKNMNTRIQHKHDSEANWNKAVNFIPIQGEIIVYDIDEIYNYERVKIGDGIRKVNDLPFVDVQPDWNQNDETALDYVKNRPFYEETIVLAEAYDDTPADAPEGYHQYCMSEVTFEDKEYTVLYDGVEYTVGCGIGYYAGSQTLYIGTDPDTITEDIPFSIFTYNRSMGETVASSNVKFLDTATEHTLQIVGDPIVHQLDPKYIKDMYYEEVTETNITGTTYADFPQNSADGHGIDLPLVLGHIWKVEFANISSVYECEVQQTDDGTLYIGDYPDCSTMPFYITSTVSLVDGRWAHMVGPGSMTLTCISGVITEPIVHQIKPKFVGTDWNVSNPEEAGYIKNRTHYDDEINIPKTNDELDSIINSHGGLTSGVILEDLTFRVIVDGVIYDNVPACYAYIAGGETWGIGDVYDGRASGSNRWSTTNYGFAYTIFGTPYNSEMFPDGIQNIEVYAVERDFKHLDPKYIKDMYYTSEPVETEIVPETTVEFTATGFDGRYNISTDPIELVIGNTYKVIWDNVEYQCKCYESVAGLSIGSAVIGGAGNTDNGEPFFIALFEGTVVMASETGTHTFSIAGIKQEIHHVPTKYIKDMYYDNGTTVTELVSSQTVSGFVVMNDPIYAVMNPFDLQLTEGNTYIVNWDGTEYELVADVFDGIIYIGNQNYVTMMSGGDIPFTIIADSNVFVVTESTVESHTMSITEIKHDLKQIDVKYLPIMEETFEIVFEATGVVGGEITNSACKKLVGQHKVTVDDISEVVEFIEDVDAGIAQTSFAFIEMWDGGAYFDFQDDAEHYVKIEAVKNIVKKEHLPDTSEVYIAVIGQNYGRFHLITGSFDEMYNEATSGKIVCLDGVAGRNFLFSYNLGELHFANIDIGARRTIITVHSDNSVSYENQYIALPQPNTAAEKGRLIVASYVNNDGEVIACTTTNAITLTDEVNGFEYIIRMRDGNLTSMCKASSIEVTTLPTKVSYAVGETLDLADMVVTLTRQDGSTEETNNYTYTEPNLSSAGTKNVRVSYVEAGETYTTSFSVTVA